MSELLLAFALYVTLEPVDALLAQMAMYWRLGESFIGGVGVIFGFARLNLYSSSRSIGGVETDRSQALAGLIANAFGGYNIGAIFFSIGSILFFYQVFKSRYIPRILSVAVTILCFGSLIFPEHAATLRYGWAPMAIAEVVTGFWLMLFAVNTHAGIDQQTA